MMPREIDPEHNWFWQQGYHDGLDGLRKIAPDEVRHSFQRSDYYAGYEEGAEERRRLADMLESSCSSMLACDVCGEPARLRTVVVYGIETAACAECLGDEPDALVPNGGSFRLNGFREPTEEPLSDGQRDDDDNWRDGSLRDGMRRARREEP